MGKWLVVLCVLITWASAVYEHDYAAAVALGSIAWLEVFYPRAPRPESGGDAP